ncbi:hypothetical protein G4358_10105 [Dorea formicigenerans]|uniref:hypothetical protein n=1 Tax=Dorea formicigenerans TaxID=39486 RepID=UPI0015703860|nr:hypothetical protein [Dorea formicigenerans]NSE47638.1 hypothetical protein [Dorea formicigenerans]
MEENIMVKEEMPVQASGFIEQAARDIYAQHPHEVKAILFGAASLILGFGACKEYELIPKLTIREEV